MTDQFSAEPDREHLLEESDTTFVHGIQCSIGKMKSKTTVTPPAYRKVDETLVHLAVWSRHSPPPVATGFGEIGDVWVALPDDSPASLYVRYEHYWRPAEHDLLAQRNGCNVGHPYIAERQLCLVDGTLDWSSRPSAKRHRSVYANNHVRVSNDVLLRLLYNDFSAALNTRTHSEDPAISTISTPSPVSGRKDATLDDPTKVAAALQAHGHVVQDIRPLNLTQKPDSPAPHAQKPDQPAPHDIEDRTVTPRVDQHLLPVPGEISYDVNARTTTWWNMVATILPRGHGTPDSVWTSWAADVSQDATQSPSPGILSPLHVVDITGALPCAEERRRIKQTIRDALSRGQCVIVKGGSEPLNYGWNKESFKELSGSKTLDLQVEWIGRLSLTAYVPFAHANSFPDAALRRDDFEGRSARETIHVSGSLLKFLSEADSGACVNMMDIPLYNTSRPWFIDGIADDTHALRGNDRLTRGAVFPDDLFRMGAWALATTGGFWTDIHHDANGCATWVTVSSGAKIWVLFTPKQPDGPGLIDALSAASLIHSLDDPSKLQEHFYVTSVLLEPGSWLIQPPGQLHAVYTPVKSIMYGGHLLLLETMHQTLLTRRLEYLTNHAVTNASHPAVDRLLAGIVISLGREGARELPVLTISSLVELILQGGDTLYKVAPQSPAPEPPQKGTNRQRRQPRCQESRSPGPARKRAKKDKDDHGRKGGPSPSSAPLNDHELAFLVLQTICTQCAMPFDSQEPPTIPWTLPSGPRVQVIPFAELNVSDSEGLHRLKVNIADAAADLAGSRERNMAKVVKYLDQFRARFQAHEV